MINIEKDIEYKEIINHILLNDEFNQIKKIEHHGVTRFDHSLKVSYYSYRLAKMLKLDSEDVARGGLLHDFFMSNEDRTVKDRFISTFVHPKKAVKNSNDIFNISEKEKDIIRTHMFPVNLAVPKYAESWLVSIVDKVVGLSEFGHKFGYKLAYLANVYLLFFINTIK
ncbi:MAG: HD domain-containing protein [Firmicutes bacterium]|nr:HD domain-containing protein [Bacillota bacterium]